MAQSNLDLKTKEKQEPISISDDWQLVDNPSPKIHTQTMDDAADSHPLGRFKYLTISLGCHINQLEPYIPAVFSLSQPATSWFRTTHSGKPDSSLEHRIAKSVAQINRVDGTAGIIQVLLWAVTFKAHINESSFWRKVEEFSLELLDGNYLVLFNGYLDELTSVNGHDFPAFVNDGECFYLFRMGKGRFGRRFGPIAYSDGLSILGLRAI
ncbi:uncharacterized protein LY89DRAFT_742368 [Mollisia scopiformis]|uniref:Uncharacterized protein n=1 Tax=Mollisia scopiformis TaxID=149040 RepID=A0A132B869_MOLSC|nr:uncharacterized protein LY89DRAFT_742368 [Mollisia scopiformis]KUJ08074.1 hypothetical protein LY89DRAFT_742368 [Mollisia scopiformis]